jgi:hypothetical protein
MIEHQGRLGVARAPGRQDMNHGHNQEAGQQQGKADIAGV